MTYYPKLTSKLLQPHIIALLASVGIHVMLFKIPDFDLEKVTSPQQPETEQRTVKLVYLNSAERNRLPNISSIPPNSSIQSRIPNLPNIPNYQSLIPHPLQSIYPQATLPTQTPLPSPLPLPNANYSHIPNYPPPPPLLPSNNLPPLANMPDLPPQETATTTNPTPPEPVEETATPQEQELVARRQATLLTEVQQLAHRLQLDDSNTSKKEARNNYVNWIIAIKNVQPEQLEITGTYPQDACIAKLTGTTAYGIVVDDSGNVTDLKLIQSSGYPLLNEKAIADIQKYNFTNQTTKPYLVFINYKYDNKICPSLNMGQNP